MVDRYIVLSEFSRRKFCDGFLPANKLVVKPNFIYPDPGVGNQPRRHAVFVGRLSREKGIATLLSAWERLQFPIPLQIIGGGPLEEMARAQASEKGLSSITFRGRLESKQVMNCLQKARFLILPSECYENCPTVILEAYACGCPVIASNIGAMQEFVDNGRTGIHFRAGDTQHLAERITSAWLNASETERMGRQARLEYETKYTAEKSYQSLMDIYLDLISKRFAGRCATASTETSTANLLEQRTERVSRRDLQTFDEEHRHKRPA
jgi:glycosyltransferase involved in cell wall biosynthesis